LALAVAASLRRRKEKFWSLQLATDPATMAMTAIAPTGAAGRCQRRRERVSVVVSPSCMPYPFPDPA
jgi:hypothetical protein